jgi:hypothetical protein
VVEVLALAVENEDVGERVTVISPGTFRNGVSTPNRRLAA